MSVIVEISNCILSYNSLAGELVACILKFHIKYSSLVNRIGGFFRDENISSSSIFQCDEMKV